MKSKQRLGGLNPTTFHSKDGSAGEEPACSAGNPGWIPGLGRPPGEGKGRPPTAIFWPGEFHDCIVQGVTERQTRMSDGHVHFQV